MFPGLPNFSHSSASVYYTECKAKKRGRPGNKNRSQILLPHSEVDNITMGVHIPVCGEPSARWARLMPLLSSPLIGSQLVAGGLERVLRMEVGVVLPLVLTTSCRGRRRERKERKGVGWKRKALNVRCTSLLVQMHSKLISVYQSSCVMWRGRVELIRV